MRIPFVCLALLWQALSTWANVEKIIFITPDIVSSASHINLGALDLDVISPSKRVIRRRLPANFANSTHPLGSTTWLLLEDLVGQQRYEVRVCWAATQPTSFTLRTFNSGQVSKLPDFLSSFPNFAEFSHSPSKSQEESDTQHNYSPSEKLHKKTINSHLSSDRSIGLFLQISAAADYFSTNAQLMQHVPPVNVDIILDPYLLNILPASLLLTSIYLTIIAIGAWVLSNHISLALHAFAKSPEPPTPFKKRN